MLSFSSNSRTFPTYHVTFGVVALDIFELYRKKLLRDTRQVLSQTQLLREQITVEDSIIHSRMRGIKIRSQWHGAVVTINLYRKIGPFCMRMVVVTAVILPRHARHFEEN